MAEPNEAPLKRLVREFGGYGVASLFGLGTDMGLLQLLVAKAHVHYLVASTISFICGGAVVYLLSVVYVFRFRRIDRRTLELSYFIALGAAGLVVNALVIYVAVSAGHLHYMVGKVLAAGGTFCTNFFLRRYFLFSPALSTSGGGKPGVVS
jgi:putative flippase GtrA